MPKQKILIVEDDRDINELIQYNLEREGYRVVSCHDGEEALDMIQTLAPHLIILDLMLPGIGGLELCEVVKSNEKTRKIPIIMLTAKREETDIVVGLQLGADDYVPKPFSPKILVARVKAVLRRFSEKPVQEERIRGNFIIDTSRRKVIYKGKTIVLTTIEFNILEYLSQRPGRVFSRNQILDGAWKEGKYVVDRAVDVHIRSLRRKLGKGADYIETVRGAGYCFKET